MARLATMASASVIDGAIQRKMHGRGVVRGGKRVILDISNEDMNDLIWTFSYFHFCCQWLCFNLIICFINWHSDEYYKFSSRIRNLCNHCRNLKVSHQGKRQKHDHIVVSSKTKFNIIEVLTSKTLCNSSINHGKFVSANKFWQEDWALCYYSMKF